MSRRMWIGAGLATLVILAAVFAITFFMGRGMISVVEPPVPPAPTRPASPTKQKTVKPAVVAPTAPQQAAPAAAQTIINIYYGCCQAPPAAPVATPPAVSRPTPPAPTAPPADDCSEAYKWQCSSTTPPLPAFAPRANMLPPVWIVNVLRYGGWSYEPTRWVPGYQRWVCEGPPPPAGPGCYYKWEPAHYE